MPVQNIQYKINSFIFYSLMKTLYQKFKIFNISSSERARDVALKTIFVVFNLETSQAGEKKYQENSLTDSDVLNSSRRWLPNPPGLWESDPRWAFVRNYFEHVVCLAGHCYRTNSSVEVTIVFIPLNQTCDSYQMTLNRTIHFFTLELLTILGFRQFYSFQTRNNFLFWTSYSLQ